VARLRRALAALPLPTWPDGRIRLAADVSNWLRPDAATSPELPWQPACPPGRLTQPESGPGSGTSARPCPTWPARLPRSQSARAAGTRLVRRFVNVGYQDYRGD
jgi:hypothetical protein